MKGIGPHLDRTMCTLRLKNRTPSAKGLFVTVLEAHSAGAEPAFAPAIVSRDDTALLTLTGRAGEIRFTFEPGQEDPTTPIFRRM